MVQFSFRDFLFQYLIRAYALGVPLHEYCHLITLRILGGQGEILSWSLNQMQYLSYTHEQLIITAFAGGIVSSIVWAILSFNDKDMENAFVSKVITVSQLVYGLFEGTSFVLGVFPLIWIGDIIGAFVVFGLVVIFVLRKCGRGVVCRLV